jgi:hypothetical protein
MNKKPIYQFGITVANPLGKRKKTSCFFPLASSLVKIKEAVIIKN